VQKEFGIIKQVQKDTIPLVKMINKNKILHQKINNITNKVIQFIIKITLITR